MEARKTILIHNSMGLSNRLVVGNSNVILALHGPKSIAGCITRGPQHLQGNLGIPKTVKPVKHRFLGPDNAGS